MGRTGITKTGVAAAVSVMLGLAVTACSGQGDSTDAGSSPNASTSASGHAPASGSSSSGSSASSSSSAPKPAASVTIGSAGDILVHASVRDDAAKNAKNAGEKGYDFDPIFAAVKPAISALDVAICQMETPISATDTDFGPPGTMSFIAPRELAPAVKSAGYDGCNRTSNHTVDRGLPGVVSTQAALSKAGLVQQGPSPNPTTQQDAAVYDVKGVKVANLAYTYTTKNASAPNTDVPADLSWFRLWLWPVVKAQGIIADATRAKKAGADVVVVSMHWGTEYHTQPSAMQQELAKQLLASPQIDMIFGAHAHVPQQCEKINGKYVIYGMGNQLSNQGASRGPLFPPSSQDGMITKVTWSRGADGTVTQRMAYQPTHVDLSNHRIQLATKTQNADAYQRVTQIVGGFGARCDATPTG